MSRVLAYEWVRAATIRSTFVFPALGILVAWVAALLTVRSGDGVNEISLVGLVGNAYSPITAVLVTIPFAQSFGHEYRDGTMRLTLSEYPNRTQVFLAKLLVPAAVAAVAAAISVLGIAAISLTVPTVEYGALPGLVVRQAAFTILWGLLVAAVTIITRIMAAGIAGVLIWGLIFENLFGSLLAEKVPVIANNLPISNGVGWAQTGNTKGGLVMLGFTVVLLAAAYWSFTRRDA